MMRKKPEAFKNDFNSVTIKLASPDLILERSHGQVTKPETINYRTIKPELGGLFCERIFGPVKDYECYCGKYKRIRYKGIICDKCGVELTEKKVRRERMGHIELNEPVVHIWFFRSLPNKIGYLLGMSSKNLASIIYYEKYVVIQPGIMAKEGIKKMDLLTQEEYEEIMATIRDRQQSLSDDDPDKFIAKMGAEAIYDLLKDLDLDMLSYELRHKAANETSQQRKTEALKRLQIVEAFREGMKNEENRPEWMVITHLPVIPPELRPLVPLEGGRFASADLNDLYRRVIIRNNRLKKLKEIKAPEVILRNEKRMIQEAVDSLFDNSRKSNAVKSESGRPLKSLSDILKGKQGRFRQNLLGKRVDYSGRSVIVVGPTLKLHECGLPKAMASELFKPFIIRRLIERGIVKTVKSAKKLVDRKDPVIWDVLENILKGHPVLLNRAPTLHRLSIQAFKPVLIEGKAIQLHPLVCGAFNADFDGDQMAVHVPLSHAAILEAQVLMLSSHNILNPQNGTPITLPSQDMVLGLYYLTKQRHSTKDHPVKGEGMRFANLEDVIIAFNEGKVDLHAGIKLRQPNPEYKANGQKKYIYIDTTVGRVIFNTVVPKEVGYINELLTKKSLKRIIRDVIEKTNIPTVARFLDDIKDMGFYWAFKGGLSFNLGDLLTPSIKEKVLKEAQEKVDEVWEMYNAGLVTNTERYNQIIDKWTFADNVITENLMKELSEDKGGFNPVFMMLDSGARGSKAQIKQLCGLRGLMAKPRKSTTGGGAIIENPILSNFLEGLSILEYFISTHGARKGLADTALKTADAGYLTRRLVDVAQDVVIFEEDCDTLRGIEISALKEGVTVIETLAERIDGRYALDDIVHPDTGEVLVKGGEYITPQKAKEIEAAGIDRVVVRSVLTCESERGVCVKCYGKNLATGRPAEVGDAVGIIAAQSIGEPGTQLTLRTFHVGGVASVAKSQSNIIAQVNGVVRFENVKTIEIEGDDVEAKNIVISRSGELRIVDPKSGRELIRHHVPYGSTLYYKDGDTVERGKIICEWDPFNAVIISEATGIARFQDIVEGVTYRVELDEQTGFAERVIKESKGRGRKKVPTIHIIDPKKEEILKSYSLPVGAYLTIDDGDHVYKGQIIAKIPRAIGGIADITGGLPRVTELFEARNPSNPAVISEIEGVVRFGKVIRGKRTIEVINEKTGEKKKYLVDLSKHILVQDGDFVRAGDRLTDGPIAPRDILNTKGPFAVQRYLVQGVQEVYRAQGISINDKHIEIIVRQMMRRVEIIDPGDTKFLEGEAVPKHEFFRENDRISEYKVITDAGDSERFLPGMLVTLKELREEISQLKRSDKKPPQYRDAIPATSKPIVEGITRSSLGVQSWISAASFQETTKVLSMAAIAAKKDTLQGLKENVIVGKKIPAGTGLRKFEDLFVFAEE